MYNHEKALHRRDAKLRGGLTGIAPLWIRNEQWLASEESFLFDLIYQHSIYGWVQQRFKYDAFNDVLYHWGERVLSESEGLDVQETLPYLEAEIAIAVPNNPKPRGS